jgi:signal transduction histidine kinase/CheY-like chemotaxis protein
MPRLSIARSLRLALVGLTLVLAAVAAVGVASLYNARQRYEDVLQRSAQLSVAAAHQATAEIAAGRNPTAATLGARAVQARQQALANAARRKARSDSRRALLLVAIAGLLALAGALALVSIVVRSMTRPLSDLVDATRAIARWGVDRRVSPSGPRELRELGASFNGMAEDLATARDRLEDERRRLAAIIESLGDALIVTLPGSPVVDAVNPRAAELLPELPAGARVDTRDSPLPPLEDALAGETILEHRGRTLAINAIKLDGPDESVVWTAHDITARAQLEKAKSDFVATASHELRSPLTSIKGFVELLKGSPENMSPRQLEFVDIILKSTDRLVDLVNDLLDVARIEADHVEINRRPIDVGEAVREVTDLMAPRIADKDQDLGTYIAPALPLAMADAARVRQIVANLLTNAHLYTPDGGKIHVGVEPERAWVQIVVEDSGVGMTEEQRARVFERFYRGRTGGTPGTGLGLSIVKSLVDLHHGQIEVDSEPGRGTRFTVRLPMAVPDIDSAALLESMRGRAVLVVDDEREIAELIADQLAPLEVKASIALSGEEALERLRSDRFDAVTLDILMPGMDGFAVLRAIRADAELRDIPIVFVSVFSGRQELAGEWIVAKPIDADELRDVLAAALRAGRSRVLVVAREELQTLLEPALDELGIEYQWEVSGAAAARVCGERRFEVALLDVGIRNPVAVLQALDLRGRRLRRAVIMFTDGSLPTPPGISKLGMEVVPVDQAALALLGVLHGERQAERPSPAVSG